MIILKSFYKTIIKNFNYKYLQIKKKKKNY